MIKLAAKKSYDNYISLSNAILDDLRAKVEKRIGSDGVKTARDAAFATLASHWDLYSSGMTDEQITKMEGHPISGSQINAAAAVEKYGTVLAGARKGGATAYRYLLYNKDALDKATSDGESIPYWYMFEWGSGSNFDSSAPESATRSYPTRNGEPTNITKSYSGRWYWYPKSGYGDRGKGYIISVDKVNDTSKLEEMEDFPAGHMFQAASDSFIRRMDDFMRVGA